MPSDVLARTRRQTGEESKSDTRQIPLDQLLATHGPATKGGTEAQLKNHERDNDQNGRERERPRFFGFQLPKRFVGSLPPVGTACGARRFL